MPTNGTMDDEITERQKLMMALIVEKMATDLTHQPPSLRELVEAMNARLPKRANGNPALSGPIQITRLAEQLRRLGLLVDLAKTPEARNRYYNLIPTAKGTRLGREWLREVTQK